MDRPRSNLRVRRRRRRIILGTILTCFILIILGAAVGLTWLPFLRISSVHVTGAGSDGAGIEQLARSEMSGGYLHLFAKSNIFLYPKGDIKKKLLQAYPTVSSVDVHAENFQTLSVIAMERQTMALWCGVEVASSSECFLLDKDGVVYAPAASDLGDTYQKFYGEVQGSALPQEFLPASSFHSLTSLLEAFKEKHGLSAASINIDDSEDVRVIFDNGFGLIFALEQSDVMDNFELALKADPFKAHALAEFEYLDLRFGDKLYYKLRGSKTTP